MKSNEASTVALRNEVAVAEISKLNSIFDQMGVAAVSVKGGIVNGVNLMREAGLLLQAWCGHEMMTYHFWKTNCEGKLKYDFETAKHFMSVARRMPKPAANLQEAFSYTQLFLLSEGMIELPKRDEKQIGASLSPFQRWCNDFTGFRQGLIKMKNETPMEQWEPPALSKFLAETDWLEEERERAKTLLGKE